MTLYELITLAKEEIYTDGTKYTDMLKSLKDKASINNSQICTLLKRKTGSQWFRRVESKWSNTYKDTPAGAEKRAYSLKFIRNGGKFPEIDTPLFKVGDINKFDKLYSVKRI